MMVKRVRNLDNWNYYKNQKNLYEKKQEVMILSRNEKNDEIFNQKIKRVKIILFIKSLKYIKILKINFILIIQYRRKYYKKSKNE